MEKQNCSAYLCTNACGFFGSSSLDGMCSRCHKLVKPSTSTASQGFVPTNDLIGRDLDSLITDASSSRPKQEASNKKNSTLSGFNSSDNNLSKPTINDALESTTTTSVNISKTIQPDSAVAGLIGRQAEEVNSGSCDDEDVAQNTVRSKRLQLSSDSAADEENVEQVNSSRSSSESRPGSASKTGRKINRCRECKKRVGLTGYVCRCGGTFCCMHRYSDLHECQFDYRTMGTEEIRKNNPVVKGDKVRKL